MDIQLIPSIKNEILIFEDNFKELIKSKNLLLQNEINEFLFLNPKRLRPIFVFLFAKILKIENALTSKIALISELIHNASLLHDDVIDDEDKRRGKLAFHQKINSKIAILEGDFLLSLALEELSKTSLEILNIYSDKIQKTIQGEIKQNLSLEQILNVEEYFKNNFSKTGNLFLAGLESLLTINNFPFEIQKSLKDFMINYSFAFQLKNDIDNILKNCSDIKNGNYTLPVIYFNLKNPNKTLDSITKENLEEEIKNSYIKLEEFKNNAIFSLKNIEDSIFKEDLIRLTKNTLMS